MTYGDYDPGPDTTEQELDRYEEHHPACLCMTCTYDPEESVYEIDTEDYQVDETT